jgi:hypothetical protein
MNDNKETILKIILNETPSATSEHYTDKFEITPKKYFQFARSDLEMSNEKAFNNAAYNIKKGIDCQIDTILTIFDFLQKAKTEKWDYTKKVEFLESLEITSQKTIKRVLKLKNLIEGEYTLHTQKTLDSALKTLEEFLDETKKCIKNLEDIQFDVSLHPEFNNNSADDWVFELTYKNNDFHISHLNKEILKLTHTDDQYFNFLKKYVEYWQNI